MLALLLSTLVAMAPLPSGPPQATSFVRAITADDTRAFTEMTSKPGDVDGPGFESVRDLAGRFGCVTVSSYRVSVEPESGLMLVDVAGTGLRLNRRRNCEPIPTRWYLSLDSSGASISRIEDEVHFVARKLLSAETDEQRAHLAARYSELLPAAARVIAEEAVEKPGLRAGAVATMLMLWAEAEGDPVTEAYALSALARLSDEAGDRSAARRLAVLSLATARRTTSCDAIAYAELRLAGVSVPPDQKGFESAASAAETMDDPRPAIRAMYRIFWAQLAAMDLAGCQVTTDRIRDVSKKFGYRLGDLWAQYAKASLASTSGDDELAIKLTRDTIVAARIAGSPRIEAAAWAMLAKLYENQGRWADALQAAEGSISVAPESAIGIRVYGHYEAGEVLVRLRRTSEASAHLQLALHDVSTPEGRAYDANVLHLEVHVRRAEGRYQEAIRIARDAIQKDKDSLFLVWAIQRDLGEMLIDCGEPEAGMEALRQAIDLIEARRALTSSSPSLRTQHFATRSEAYEALMSILVDQRDFGQALEIAERVKARSLEDSISGATERLPLTPEERARKAQLNQRIVDLNREVIVSPPGKTAAAIRRELLSARSDLETFQVDMSSRYQPGAEVPPASDRWSRQSGDRTIIEYSVAMGSVIAFVTAGNAMTARRLPVTASQIELLTEHLATRIQNRDLDYVIEAQALYRALIKPVATLLPRRGALVIVPDRFLWNVPFPLLRDGAGSELIQSHAISYAPSMKLLDRAAAHLPFRRGSGSLLAVGDPAMPNRTPGKVARYRDLSLGALPDAAREVREIARLYPRDRQAILVGQSARESMFKRTAKGYSVIHLATHGLIDDSAAAYSALLMGAAPGDPDDGLLEAREIAELNLDADLVVLSGCETARGSIYPGEGVVGLSWAFLAGGCPSTVVSQWKTDSRATEKLMVSFHRHLRAGETVAEALRHASLELRRDPDYAHPFYWAAFKAVGVDLHAHRSQSSRQDR